MCAHSKLTTLQTSKKHLEQFIEISSLIQNAIMDYDASVLTEQQCPCKRGGKRIFRCRDCPVFQPVCDKCLLEAHAYEPYHWGEVWVGRCFRKFDMVDIGMEVHLGHDGQKCPAKDNRPTEMKVVDSNGIHSCKIFFCECEKGAQPYSQVVQLLHSRLFPYTTAMPETAMTFRCLADFRVHTHASRKSAYDHMKALYAMTCEETKLRISVCVILVHVLPKS